MDELTAEAAALYKELSEAVNKLKLADLNDQLAKLRADSNQPDFWSDSSSAQATMQKIARLEARLKPWQELETKLKETRELIKLGDSSLKSELESQLNQLKRGLGGLKEQLKLSGAYDDHDAIISLYAGAGGTDAQDWTQMLFRMFSRYFDKNGWKYRVVDQSAGDEAGLKSVTLEVDGDYAYGKLKGEQGVHRLVRLSPFNADNLRQTSFAKVEVLPKIDQPSELAIDDKDLKVDVYRSGGHGGQSVNTTDSAVRVTHLPTGISVAIQNERSQLQNKATAMTILRSKLAQLTLEQHSAKLSELKGPIVSAEWGNQIRSYVLHPYKQVKDLRTNHTSADPDAVLNGELDPFIEAYLEHSLKA